MAKPKSKSANTTKTRSGGASHKKRTPKKTRTGSTKGNKPKIKRRRWFLLNSLVELDWDNYIQWTVAKHTLLKDKVHIGNHDYEIKPVSPISGGRSALELSAGDRFLIIPIQETGTAASQRRYVLAHEEQDFEKGQLYLADADPPEDVSASDDAFYKRIYVIGDANIELEEQEPHIIGAVEAVLTVSDPLAPWAGFPAAPPTQIVPQPPPATVTAEPSSALYDENLLNRLDSLNEIKERHSQAGEDVTNLQKSLNKYLSDQYDLKVIPIEVNKTRFDEKLGHILAGISHLTSIDDGIITAIYRNGYTRHGKLVRKANVVVNSHATRIVRLTNLAFDDLDTFQVEMNAPEDYNIGELIHETAMQIEALDSLYEWILIFATGSTVQLKDFARRLLQTSPTYENSRGVLKEANNQHLLMSSLKRDSRMLLTLRGEAKSLKKLCDILYTEARNRANKSYYPPPQQGWIFKELSGLQPMPFGIDQAKFAKESDLILRGILGRITFAGNFKFPDVQKASTQG